MNKIFKVIWSHSKECYIVVSEVAKNRSGKQKLIVAMVLAVLAMGSQWGTFTVQAAIPEGTATNGAALAVGDNVNVSNDSSTGLGKDIEVTRRFAVAVGFGVKASADNAVAIGSGARFGTIQALGNDSVAIGTRAEAGMQSSIAIGRLSRAVTGERGVAIGNEAVTTALSAVAIGNKVNATKDTAISIGNESNATATAAVAYGNKANASGTSSVALGDQSEASANNASAIGISSKASADSALAFGNTATSTGNSALAFGNHASAGADRAIAIGSADTETTNAPAATGTDSIAIGTKAKASHGQSFAIGSNVQATGVGTTALGANAIAKEEGSTAIGSGVNVATYKATAVGYLLNVRSSASTNIGYTSDVDANQALSIGARNNVTADAQYGTAVGYFAKVSAKNAVAIGSSNDNDGNADSGRVLASGESAVAIGTSAHGEATHAVAIGTRAKSTAGSTVAIGENATSGLANSVALGKGSVTTANDGIETKGYLTKDVVDNTTNGVISIGNKRDASDSGTVLRRIVGVASGTHDYDAVNIKQLKALENMTLNTLRVNTGTTTTDVVPKERKITFTAGNNITLTNNDGEITIAAKSTVNSIESANSDAISVSNTNGKVTITPNIASAISDAGEGNKLVTAGMVKDALSDKVTTTKLTEELGKKANASDITNLTNGKLDKTAELHVKKGPYAVDGSGNVTLEKVDGAGTVKADEAVTITGIASKSSVESLKTEVDKKATKAELSTEIGKVNAELAKKVSNDKFNEEMAKKANVKAIEDLKTILAGKVDKEALDKVVAAMSNKVEETTLNERLKAAKEEQAAALKAAVDAAKTETNTGVTELKENKLDKTAELHVVKGDYEINTDGDVILKKANGNNVEDPKENVVIKGVASKATLKTVSDKVDTAVGDIVKLKEKVEGNTNGLADLTTKVGKVEATANDASKKVGELTSKVGTLSDTVTAQGEKIDKVKETVTTLKKDIADNYVTNTAIETKLGDLKTELGKDTKLFVAGDKTVGADGAQADKVSINLQNQTLHVKGTADEITTEAKGDTITIGLAKTVKDQLKAIAKIGDTSSDGRDGVNGTAKTHGLTGADGLNGKTLTEKVNALRNGEAGSMVYTDDKGNRLTKANNGNYYKTNEVDENGEPKGSAQPVADDKIQATVMNPKDATKPMKVTNIGDGVIADKSKDAVTGSQLHKAKSEVATALGGGASVNDKGELVAPTYHLIDKNGDKVEARDVGTALSTINDRFQAANNATNGEVENLKSMKGLTEDGMKVIKGLAQGAVDVKGDNKNITVTDKDINGVKTFFATLSDTVKLGGKDGKQVKLDGTTGNITANAGIFGDTTGENGAPANGKSHVVMNDGGLSIVSKDDKGTTSTIQFKDGTITGLKAGTGDNDVATVGQMKDAIGNTTKVLEQTSQRVNQVGAHAAALSAMNPLGYDPMRKSQIMAGIGAYGNQQALALGLAHFANENFLFNVGFTVGEGTSMANLGATYRFGTGGENGIPDRYKGGPISSMYVLQDEVTALKAENAEMKEQIKLLMQRIDVLASR